MAEQENIQLHINSIYLGELIDYCGRSLCGKLMKRFEILDNKEVLKAETKELIYESYRSLRDLMIAHNKGLEITSFQFKQKPKKATPTEANAS